ncbi:MAG: IS1380 family transposase [Nitrospirae bacterium]|nr:IS1380 family transposase [Nitrospirota bacterium]
MMAEFNHGIEIRELVDKYLPQPRSNRGFTPSVFVDPLVLMHGSGGVSLEDIRELKYEEGLMRVIGERQIPSPDAIGKWLKRMGEESGGQKGVLGLDKVREKINQRLLKRDGIKEYTLDADATEIIAEKNDANYTYKGNKGYMPMLGFLYEAKLCIYDEFREGNASPAFGQKDFYTACKNRMPRGKQIKAFRADSASYQAELINTLEEDAVKWGITAAHDKAVKALIKSIEEGMWHEPERGCGYEIAETVHCMNKTDKSFRMVIKREIRKQPDIFDEDRYFHHVIATNWLEEEKTGYEVIQWHNQRGDAENFNKELKGGFGMERMPCGQTYANAVFFRIGVIAYNLFIGFKRLSCPDSWARHTIRTFRWKMIQVAERIVSHAGQVIIKLAVDIKKLAIFEEIRGKIFELSLAWDG